jgi:P4 family phage/plasmid primase-like protien
MFSQYLLKFVKNTDQKQTHLSFSKGKYNVPDSNFDEFYQKYFNAIKNGEELHLIEKVYASKFAFFLDIDTPTQGALDDNKIKVLIEIIKRVIFDMFVESENDLGSCIVSKRTNKYHLNFFNLIVTDNVAKAIVQKVNDIDNSFHEFIDTSVYRTGLRLIGSKKAKRDKDYYNVYDLETSTFIDINRLSFDQFMNTIVRRKEDVEISPLKQEYMSLKIQNPTDSKKVSVKGIDNPKLVSEVANFVNDLKLVNPELADFNVTLERIFPKRNRMGLFCYYISISHNCCPFKMRPHVRDSSPLYIELSISGVYIKCYDQDCLRRRFPETGCKFPSDWQTNYPELYMSMSTKYWKSDVVISDDLKQQLEESLSGSHYQIAKSAFSIYKDRFRVDDIKNTTWFEYDGKRWVKSHVMNILISEELPKYYKGIKIIDTSISNNNLQDFLVNNDKIDANLRNQMVDNLNSKLENVNFKNNVLNQICYMFKNYDPDFCNHLDSSPYLVGFNNGVYDFVKNAFRQSRPDDYLTFTTGYDYIDYDENNEHVKEIYAFLSQIITNKEVREYLLKVLGKSLVGIPEEKFYIWTGLSGANGKSTLVNFLEQTLGDYLTSVDVSLLTNKRAGSSNASPDIIRLRGRRLFAFQEPEHDDKLRTGILKQFSGGDTIVARELFKAPVSFKLQGTMIMCCNDLPHVASIDGGTWRRIRVIEFKSRFCDSPTKSNEFKIDPSLKYKIREWRPYFMSILIHWYNKYLYEGIQEPDEVKRATHKYKADNDRFNEFFDQNIEETTEHFEYNKTIYSNFTIWWSVNYPTAKLPDIRELRRAMKIKYGAEKESNINGCVQYGFNIHLKNNNDDVFE